MIYSMLTLLVCSLLLGCQLLNKPDSPSLFAPKPLYRDPTLDGAADPAVIWNRAEKKWFMFYTNRRANLPGLKDVEWMHGTPIGIAESKDGVHWRYCTDAKFDLALANATWWAPDVYYGAGQYHMYLTFVPGIFNHWKHPRNIIHLTSKNLIDWAYQSTLKLNSKQVINADVMQLPNGKYRMYYNDEPSGNAIYYAESSNLFNWRDKGRVNMLGRGEGPLAFRWQGYWWIIVDAGAGLAVFRSQDLENWQTQPGRLLQQPGTGEDDGVKGGHADVLVSDGRAYLFYFTHPGRTRINHGVDNSETRRSAIQVSELSFNGNWLQTNRNTPTYLQLVAPR